MSPVSRTPKSIGFRQVNISRVVTVKPLYIPISAEGCLWNDWNCSTLDIVLARLWFLGGGVFCSDKPSLVIQDISRLNDEMWQDIEDVHWHMRMSQTNLVTLWISWKSLILVLNQWIPGLLVLKFNSSSCVKEVNKSQALKGVCWPTYPLWLMLFPA